MNRREILHQRLQNQLLDNSTFTSVEETVKWMGAIQGQDYNPGLWAIGLRTANLDRNDILQSLADLHIVRSWTMRHTIHFAALEDIHWMVHLTRERMFSRYKNFMLKAGLGEAELHHSVEIIQKTLEGKKLVSRPSLRHELEEAGVDTGEQRYYHILWYAAQHGLIFIGPMEGKQQTLGLVEEWAPKNQTLTQEEALHKLASRYLKSHGPATVKDFSWWSGLTQKEAKFGFKLAGSQQFITDESGMDYWYLPNENRGNHPNMDKVHLIYSLDEFIIGYKDRTATWSDDLQGKLDPLRTGYIFPILFNGEVIGSWKPEINKSTLIMNYTLATTKEISLDLLYKEAERYSMFSDLILADINVQRTN